MSAITGIFAFKQEHVPTEYGSGLMEALRTYPFDKADVWSEGPVFLGCHAQWITPQSLNEQLPYQDKDTGIVITADAIVDNRNQLFDRLQIAFNQRESMTDSELIIKAYLQWGKNVPYYLLGDFAFVLWDPRYRIMIGARDLAGSRTLYYHIAANERFAFCTAIAPLLTLPGMKREIDEDVFAQYLAIPDFDDSADAFSTVYRSIKQVPPGHSFIVSDDRLTITKYGSLLPEEEIRLRSSDEYVEAFREVFQEAVSCRLRTFRQIGATLSGGLDSGSVAGFAANLLRKQNKQLHSFSSIPADDFDDFTERSALADERPFIRSTVEFVGNIKDNYLAFNGRSSLTEIDDMLDTLELPYKTFENSFWIKGIYETASAQDIGVLLTGARGNTTISWGSAVDYYALLLKRFQWIQFYQQTKKFSRFAGVRRSRVLSVISKQLMPSKGMELEIAPLISEQFASKTGIADKLRDRVETVSIWREREFYFTNLEALSLQGTAGTKLSLRHKVLERDPTCDPRVIKFCLAIPVEQFVWDGMGRSLVRRMTANILPDKVRLNQRVRGIQGADWLHRILPLWNAFIEELHQSCQDDRIADYLNVRQIKGAIERAGSNPGPERAFDPDIRFLVRSLIASRFIKKMG